MHALLVFVIVAVLSFEFLISKGFLPPIFKYTFEVFALLIAGVVLVLGVQSRFRNVPPKYWLVFGALVVIMVCGVFVNGVQPGPIFGGLRMYLRGLPFFLLPLVLLIPKRHVKVQLLVLLAFCVIQLPLAWDQRMATIARGGVTGDDTFGTLMMAKAMTLYLISGACIVTGFYLRGGLRGKYYFPLLAILLIPNMLNETKATLFLVPLGVITVYLVAARPGVRLRNSVIALTLVAAFTAVFVPVYDHFMSARWDYGIVDFFTMEGRLEGYLDRGLEPGDYADTVRKSGGAGKLGGLRGALVAISKDPAQMAFGLGVGNVSDSALGTQFDGKYHRLYQVFLQSTMTYFIFELGLLGLMSILCFYYFLFRDSVFVAKNDDEFWNAIALGWTGVVLVILVGTAYHDPMESRALTMLFWYFAGIVVSRKTRVAQSIQEKSSKNRKAILGFGN